MAKRGRPKGSKNKSTLNKELARQALQAMVMAELRPMTEAQIANAKGIKYLVAREKKTGKFVRVVDVRSTVKSGEEIIEVWEKDPSILAFTDLMNRTIDKPTETQKHEGELTVRVYKWQE